MIASYQGEIAALAAAALWAVASILYSQFPYRARDLAAAKNSLATIVLAGLLACQSWWRGRDVVQPSAVDVWLLSLSAIIGLAIGDGCYFRSIQLLGPRRALALTLLTPPMTAYLGFLALGEVLPADSWMAMTGDPRSECSLSSWRGVRLAKWRASGGVAFGWHRIRRGRHSLPGCRVYSHEDG